MTLGAFTLPSALFWIVIVYVLAATVIAFVIGRPLIRLSYLNELLNAGFRYALVRLRDASAAVGLYGARTSNARCSTAVCPRSWTTTAIGEPDGVVHRLEPVHEPGDRPSARSSFRRHGCSRADSLGDIFQSATAFHTIHNSLSFFRDAYDSFASYRAAIIRLDGLVDENSRARRFTQVTTTAVRGGRARGRRCRSTHSRRRAPHPRPRLPSDAG